MATIPYTVAAEFHVRGRCNRRDEALDRGCDQAKSHRAGLPDLPLVAGRGRSHAVLALHGMARQSVVRSARRHAARERGRTAPGERKNPGRAVPRVALRSTLDLPELVAALRRHEAAWR